MVTYYDCTGSCRDVFAACKTKNDIVLDYSTHQRLQTPARQSDLAHFRCELAEQYLEVTGI